MCTVRAVRCGLHTHNCKRNCPKKKHALITFAILLMNTMTCKTTPKKWNMATISRLHLERPCNKLHHATCSLIGRFCCGKIFVNVCVLLELLLLALWDGSNGRITWYSTASSFTLRSFCDAARKSTRDRIGPVCPLAIQTYRPHFFRIVPVLLSVSKTRQSIRCSSANFEISHV